MWRTLCTAILVLSLSTVLPVASWGATFCVGNELELINALNTAENNGENDTIKVEQGTYDLWDSAGSYYNSSEGRNITLEGGYAPGCGTRTLNPTNTVLIVIPHQRPTGDDVDRIESYLDRGGTVVLADDYGFGNVILEGVGLAYRFSGIPLLDPLFNYRNE